MKPEDVVKRELKAKLLKENWKPQEGAKVKTKLKPEWKWKPKKVARMKRGKLD